MLGCRVTECSSKRAAKDQYEADQTKIPSALTNNTRAQPRAGWGWNEKGLTSQRWKDFHLSVSDEKPLVESFVGCKQAKAISQRKQFDYRTTARHWRGNVWPCSFCWVTLTEEVWYRGMGVTKKGWGSQGKNGLTQRCRLPNTPCADPVPLFVITLFNWRNVTWRNKRIHSFQERIVKWFGNKSRR